MNEIIYNIADETLSPLPENSGEETHKFTFEGFDTYGAKTSSKKFIFIGKLTEEKKRKIIGEIIKDSDSAEVTFKWIVEKIHWDFLAEDYEKIEPIDGYIYFVRESDEEKITQENFDVLTSDYEIVEQNIDEVVNNAIEVLQLAWKKIAELGRSQS